jgi:hypothetical protein
VPLAGVAIVCRRVVIGAAGDLAAVVDLDP